jgi:hypothetical protein
MGPRVLIVLLLFDDMKEASVQPWDKKEKQAWLAQQKVQRSYPGEVVSRLRRLSAAFDIGQYGALSIDPERYPLYCLRSREWSANRPTILLTGGVHGYETSGVQGALRFLQTSGERWAEHFNLFAAPCVSPWGYETINRWNPKAVDPNRSFYPDSPAEESALLMKAVADMGQPLLVHMDLHETTDTDNTVFRPALAARDGIELKDWGIPDGFYTVGDVNNPADAFQAAVIRSVRKVTHIAQADEGGCIIGEKITQEGVINYDTKGLHLCTGFSDARFATTTEVYPDSPRTDPEECIRAQVAAVNGALRFARDA